MITFAGAVAGFLAVALGAFGLDDDINNRFQYIVQ